MKIYRYENIQVTTAIYNSYIASVSGSFIQPTIIALTFA